MQSFSKFSTELGKLRQFFWTKFLQIWPSLGNSSGQICFYPNWFGQFHISPILKGNTDIGKPTFTISFYKSLRAFVSLKNLAQISMCLGRQSLHTKFNDFFIFLI